MTVLAGVLGIFVIAVVLRDAFETIVLPRRVTRRLRLTRLFYWITWWPWSATGRLVRDSGRRESALSFYGPLSLILLLAVWAAGLVVGFAAMQWAIGSPFSSPGGSTNFALDVYVSGTTFFTLGLGDIVPISPLARTITVLEAGMGFGFLAIVIGYLPVLYQAFSQREVAVSLLDARAGSPPSAVELLRRHGESGRLSAVADFLHEWERWAAELLESHLSYPVLSYFRSQHENQSWVAALTMVLDLCALVIAGIDGCPIWAGRLTFAMARHAAVDLCQILNTPPLPPAADRLPPAELARLRAILAGAGVALRAGPEADTHLAQVRAKYEPYVNALASRLLVALPPWIPPADASDNWQTTAWGRAESESSGSISFR